MLPVVYKFGGTSLATAESIRKVYDIVFANQPRFIVVSAIAGITDLLDTFCSVPRRNREEIIRDFEQRHREIVAELQLTFSLDSWVDKLYSYADKQEISLKDRAEILALGEDVSASLFHAFCHKKGFFIEFLEARRVILTDNVSYDRAAPDIVRMRDNWDQLNLSLEKSYITQGFLGANSLGETTLLGRGGSDYTGALIAEISQANEVHIYTDVNGVYTMDPRIIKDAQLIPELSFEEMHHLARFGAKILYPSMLSPCIRAGIPIFVTSTFDITKGGSRIYATDKTTDYETRVIALSLRQNQCLWSIDCVLATISLDEILHVLEAYPILPDLITSQNATISFITDNDEVPESVICDLYKQLSHLGSVQILHDLALITMIGSGVISTQIVTEVTNKFRNYPFPVCCYFQSSTTLSLAVPENLAGNIVEQLHNVYVKQDSVA
ncbi:aspartate kinase [Chlamydia gallinacea]|uniref:Aspartokinase n=2 Tax=Chlamydia gallinacea TaxID=1457153 RepID=A0A173DXY6_9CHLA|nr:aspartate kinase [Chlamydia gallinacea]EYE60892.1 aspartate kinase domain protein [Bacteroides fragilis str. S6L5]ANG65790.1 aspartate kinase [Chlamydia gallinacea 08-1274/3]AQT77149.1 aspartate kinase [Chlamydia gallinacea]MBX6680347.1 aspartate kinase [Chlamydia gallinacea]MBX6687531.1 aspartate kinase [Chlamydia gallinacea]